MKKIKSLLAVLLTFALIFGNSLSVLAEEVLLPVETETVDTEESEIEESETVAAEDYILDESDDEELLIENETIDEVVEDTEVPEDIEILDENTEIEGSYPGVNLAGFCHDPQILEDKEELTESLEIIEGCVPGEDYVEGEIIVAAPDEETAVIYAEGFGGTLGAFLEGYCLIVLDTYDENKDGYSLSVAEAVEASADPDIALPAAYPNYIGSCANADAMQENEITKPAIEYTVSDNSTGYLSIYSDPYLEGTSERFQYQHSLMQSEAAWRNGYTGEGAKVCVIDTGAKSGHEDLNLAGMGQYDDSDYTFKSVSSLTDEIGHGTHCCGIVAAKAGNAKGGCGVAPDASLYAAKSYVGDQFNDWGLYSAMIYAVNEWKVDIISISLYTCYPEPNLEDAVTNAYNKGTVVFVASGNDSSNLLTYPASCKYAVPVGAVDEGNTKVFFSNQTSKVRYSGPGYNIYSTYNESDSSYCSMNGTSMACPAVAGAAAVLLSSGKVTGSGPKKVDNLLALMDKGATKSGIGKGTPNIAKSLGIGNYSASLDAPKASLKSGSKINAASGSVAFASALGTKLYFNTSGGNMTYKNGIVSNYDKKIESNMVNLNLNAPTTGKYTIKAMAVDEVTGLCSKVASFTYTFTKAVSLEITSKNPDFIVAKGSSLQLGATVYPKTAVNKAVTWEIVEPTEGISIDKKGKLTVDKSVTAVSVTVKATAADGSEVYALQKVTISDQNTIKSVSLTAKKVTVYTEATDESTIVKAIDINGSEVLPESYCKVSSANSSIATASISGNALIIKGGSTPGKTTITCYSNDGAFKKTTVTVTVLQKVTGASIITPGILVQGGTFNQKATVQPENASNKKLIWSIVGFPAATLKECGVTVNPSTGQIKIPAKAKCGPYTLKYEAADKQGFYGTVMFMVNGASEKIKKLSLSTNNITIFRVSNKQGAVSGKYVNINTTGGYSSRVMVTDISAPGLVNATTSTSQDGAISIHISATGKGCGEAKVTVSTTDGTNLKQVIKVKVVNPPSKLLLSLPADRTDLLGYGATLKLVPTFYTDYGPIDASSKKLVWTSSNPNIMTVSSNGTVKTVSPNANPATVVNISAAATDGSGLRASISLYSNPYVPKIGIYYQYQEDYANMSVGFVTLGYFYTYKYGDKGICWDVSYSVNGPQGGCVVKNWGQGEYDVEMTKKGNYTVTFRLNDGTNRKTKVKFNCKYNY